MATVTLNMILLLFLFYIVSKKHSQKPVDGEKLRTALGNNNLGTGTYLINLRMTWRHGLCFKDGN
jgi:hypothetical protein